MRKGAKGDARLSAVFAIDEGTSDSDLVAGPSVSGYEGRMAGASVFWGSPCIVWVEINSAEVGQKTLTLVRTNKMNQGGDLLE